MKRLCRRIRRIVILALTLVFIFTLSLIISGGICNSNKIWDLYKEFYGTWSWKMILCLAVSGLISGVIITCLIKKTGSKSNEES